MPTENKTTNLSLNNWLGTDKPQRSDFVEDNQILDEVIGNHLSNYTMHFSSSDRELLKNPFAIGGLAGDGNATCTHTFDFNPRCVFVFLKNAPFLEYDTENGYTVCNSAVVTTSRGGGTLGASLLLNELTLSQSTTAENRRFINLNKDGGQYFYIAFK